MFFIRNSVQHSQTYHICVPILSSLITNFLTALCSLPTFFQQIKLNSSITVSCICYEFHNSLGHINGRPVVALATSFALVLVTDLKSFLGGESNTSLLRLIEKFHRHLKVTSSTNISKFRGLTYM